MSKQQAHHKYLSTENEDHEAPQVFDETSNSPESFDNKKTEKKAAKRKILPEIEEIEVVEARFCTVCCLEQPMRAKHCRECGKCIAVHDHHCP